MTTAPTAQRDRRPRRAARRVPTLAILVATAVVVAALGSLDGRAGRAGRGSGRCRAAAAELDPDRVERSAAHAAAGPTVLGATVTFYGRGYGHGVGMSQYGARGRALAGEDAAAILAHYYQRHDARDGRPDEHHPGPRAARLEGDLDPRR